MGWDDKEGEEGEGDWGSGEEEEGWRGVGEEEGGGKEEKRGGREGEE